jgi:DNA polymerase-3 subunit gamma/tau
MAASSSVSGGHATQAALATAPVAMPVQTPITSIATLADVKMALEQGGYMALASHVYLSLHLVKLEEGRLEFRASSDAPPTLAQDLTKALKDVSGKRWMVTLSSSAGAPTLHQQEQAAVAEHFAKVKQDPLVAQVFDIFPDATLKNIHTKQ